MPMDYANRAKWHRSIVAKIFLISFVCIHVPLIALLINFATVPQSDALTIGLVVLGATLAGTVACLVTMWWLTRPLRNLAIAISRYRIGGPFVEEQLNKHGDDEIAVVTRAVCGMVGEISALAERIEGQPGLDPLTGLLNGSAAYGMQLASLARQVGGGAEIVVAVFELEATSASLAGLERETVDLTLVAVGDVVREHFSPRQVAARMSDTTFVLVFAGDAPATVSTCCESIRRAVGELEVGSLARGSLRVTFAIATRRGNEAMADLLHQADMALFRAKDIRRTGLEVLQR